MGNICAVSQFSGVDAVESNVSARLGVKVGQVLRSQVCHSDPDATLGRLLDSMSGDEW